jgi:two-component system LytT family response regulator
MQTFKAIIVDDEENSIQALRAKLTTHCPQVIIIAECFSAEEGIKAIEEMHPDIVFLDVQMPRVNGFVMLKQLVYKSFDLIFTTAYNHYAIDAIRVSALDYLVKPVEVEELKAAIVRVGLHHNASHTNEKIETLLYNFLRQASPLKRIAVPTLEGFRFIDTADIIYLEANNNYTIIYLTGSQKITVTRTLKDFEEILPTDIFIRIHHAYIIHINHTISYTKGTGGQVVMRNGSILDVARRKKEEFLRAFNNVGLL